MAKLSLGKQQVSPDKPSHTRGVAQGNATGNYAKQPGFKPDGRTTAESATGVNPSARNPIDPRMPGLFPG
jgi:hypothetical protein